MPGAPAPVSRRRTPAAPGRISFPAERRRFHADGNAETYFNWTATEQDNTHFNPPGAIAMARLVAGELLRTRVLTPHDVVRLHDEIPPSWITWPEASSAPDA
ncbi:hypothetical protein [Streptomyces sp. NRRL S-813]|uniref:hypothetical protein n=1 Tax=Streptomyces sp. NRRL S-813 TaxID=1463919 RepID=UPI000A731DF3